jgi:hypothetical protein
MPSSHDATSGFELDSTRSSHRRGRRHITNNMLARAVRQRLRAVLSRSERSSPPLRPTGPNQATRGSTH